MEDRMDDWQGDIDVDSDSPEVIESAVGFKIKEIKIDDYGDAQGVFITFDPCGTLVIADKQSCCEERYMTCDDDLTKFIGATFLGARVSNVGAAEFEIEDDDGYERTHGFAFLIVETSLGSFTVGTHVMHNGYYGGFWLSARWDVPPTKVGYMATRIVTEGNVGGTPAMLSDEANGIIGAVFIYATKEIAEAAANGATVFQINIPVNPR